MSAKISVLFFASLREDVGVGGMEAHATDTAELLDVLQATLSRDAMSALRQDNVRIAVNQQLIEGSVELHNGDEVAFLPPVTGG